MTDKAMSMKALHEALCKMANDQLVSPEYRRLYNVPFNREAGRVYILQRAHFVLNRRSCWAHVQGASPFDVKGLIWEHEQEELIGDPERGMADHYTLGVQEGESVGLKPADFEKTPPTGGVQTACYAWLHLARDKPWLEALAASCILEIANSDAIVKGGGNARRIGEKMRDELGIPFKKQQSNAEHMVAEVEHANLLMKVASKYGGTPEAQAQIMRGASASLAIDRVYKDTLAQSMEAMASVAAA
jgi:pyrroloquinoline quinone (PQQ) biosynthesis protein C